MISQLSLFDTSAAVGSFYKPGDWVKIKKVPAIAKQVKCGQVYQLTSVETRDGRLEFWNPFTAQWDFLCPNEVKLALTPADHVDSVSTSNAQIADTEYAVPPADNNDSVSKAIFIYHPRDTARSGEYFRFSYRDGSRMKHIHICGGNTDSPIAPGGRSCASGNCHYAATFLRDCLTMFLMTSLKVPPFQRELENQPSIPPLDR